MPGRLSARKEVLAEMKGKTKRSPSMHTGVKSFASGESVIQPDTQGDRSRSSRGRRGGRSGNRGRGSRGSGNGRANGSIETHVVKFTVGLADMDIADFDNEKKVYYK